MPNTLVFHESFDSTRTAGSGTGANLAQAQAEALISLLLGHSLALNNTYAFDSRGVLELVTAVLAARDDVIASLRSSASARDYLTRDRPFLLTWYGANSFVEACAAQLRKCDPTDLEHRFLLSAWGAIDLSCELRTQLADALLADPRLVEPSWLAEYPGLVGHFDALRTIIQYAGKHGRGRPASTEQGTDLVTYLKWYHQLGSETGPLPGLAERWGCPADIAMELWRRIDSELRQKDGETKLGSRSWIHVAVRVANESEDPDRLTLEQLKELIDTFYNARLAESAYAEHDFLSSVPRSSDVGEMKNVNDLAVGVIGDLRPDAQGQPLAGVFTSAADEPKLEVAPLRQLFRAYWEIIADDDRRRAWQESCEEVNRLLRAKPDAQAEASSLSWAGRFSDAWADHMSLLARQLPELVRTDDGSVSVAVRQDGADYRLVEHARPSGAWQSRLLTSGEVDTALATSRHVSNMVRWGEQLSQAELMLIDEIMAVLTDAERSAAPEPTLLPWLAARIGRSELPTLAQIAAEVSPLAPREGGWPVIADAVAEVVANRDPAPDALTDVINALPPVAAHLGRTRGGQVNWARVRSAGRGYAVLAGVPVPGGVDELADQPLWAEVLRASRMVRVPLLADLRSLASFVATDVAGEAIRLTDEEAVYLLPLSSPGAAEQDQAVEAIAAAAAEGRHWYAAALTARAAPYLEELATARVRTIVAAMPPIWSAHLVGLVDEPRPQWASDRAELAASHPEIAQLNRLAADADPVDLARASLEVTREIARRHGVADQWEPDVEGWQPPPGIGQVYVLGDYSQRLLERRRSGPIRHVNVYVAAAGQDEPVPPAPLDLRGDYEVRCNIGPFDARSLVDREVGQFPDELLPDGPLQLHAVLFVDGGTTAHEPIELPAAGASAWASLPLPRSAATGILTAELAIYYQATVVMLFALTIPVGVGGAGPEVKMRYRLTRSLADLSKLAGRSLSFVEPGTASALYVNGLTFAGQAFAHIPDQVNEAAFNVRTTLYKAHFIGRAKGEITRYTISRGCRYCKSRADLIADLRQLARSGAAVYKSLFRNLALPELLRAEADVYGRPPIVQVVSLGQQLLPIPWAAVYDLPVSGHPEEYKPCRSITDYGPGGRAASPPARCPYEQEHRNGSRWKLNQLCPWGFWGLSAIIEHPPSVWQRDLESQVQSVAEEPVILMGYDTNLDPDLCRAHLRALRSQHGNALLDPQVVKRLTLKEALDEENMDIVYLYCHIVSDREQPGETVPAIELGSDQVTPDDISGWSQVRLPTRHPLVVINGCRTVEVTSGSLFNFVDAFVNWGQAAGVVGTEITIEQGLGGWAMELFLSALRELPVGEALRSVRWTMFRNGNLMGLGYTPYCLAGLTLRSLPEEQ